MIKLVGDRVAIVPIENPEMSPGGIIIPEMAKDRLNQGFIKYIGPTVQELKIGMYVIFSGFSGTLAHLDGEGKLIVMREKFVKAIVRDGNSIPVPGLYFRSGNKEENVFKLYEVLINVLPDLDESSAIDLARKMADRGAATHDAYFVSNYETMMSLLAQAFSESKEWRDSIVVANNKEHEWETQEYLNEGGA